MTARVGRASRGGVDIAYEVTGAGRIELLVVHDFAGHLELDRGLPGADRLFERLASFARVIRFDKRGTGLSDAAVVTGPSADAEDASAVLDAAGVTRAAVFGWGDGVAAAVILAARHPERVSTLVLYGGTLRPARLGAAIDASERALSQWGERIPDGFAPPDEDLARAWPERSRAAAPPTVARALVLTAAQADVTADAAGVRAPVVVLARRGDPVVPAEDARALAEAMPAGRFVLLEGDAHLPYVDPDQIADAIETAVTGSEPRDPRGIGGYDLEGELARGGMGTVHLARDRRLGRRVALKVLPPEYAHDAVFRERFLREQRTTAALEHPAVVPVYDAGEADGRLYLAMRHVEGTDLRRLIDDEGPLDPVAAVRLLSPVAGALDAAHARGLVHRDVKPANVLLDRERHPYLCDFGLTKDAASAPGLTGTGQLVGTLDYLAPEQIRGEAVDVRADVYALGCVLYECVTGRAPFAGRSEAQTLWGHVQEEPVPPSQLRPGLPAALDAVVERALAKDPEERYASAGELAAAARVAVGIDAPAVIRRRRRRAVWAVAVGAAFVTAAAGAAFGLAGCGLVG